jgi:hypothetical protein
MVPGIRTRFRKLSPVLDERSRRRWSATEAIRIGHGGIEAVAIATGLSRSRIARGCREIKLGKRADQHVDFGKIRKRGGGRKSSTELNSHLLPAIEKLVSPTARGDPMNVLRWSLLSTRQISEALAHQGISISHTSVAKLLHQIGYSLQANMKTKEGSAHIDRNAQFQYINDRAGEYLLKKQPVISIDTKKKELIGNFKNNGREWRPSGKPERVRVHDFLEPEKGKAIPYGVYDVGANEGWVSVGIDHDTAEFAGQAVMTWWKKLGIVRYPRAKKLLITADGGGSNGARSRLWKYALQRVADKTGLEITMTHFPPGTSKWNKIEHKMFSFITLNWRGRPLISHEVIVKLIGNTTTKTGLKIKSALDKRRYLTGLVVAKEVFEQINIRAHDFHPDWNYTISPRRK